MEDSRRTGAASVWISFFLDPRDHLLPTKNERKMRKKRKAKKITTEATNENPAKQFTETRKKEKKRKEDRTSSVQNKQTNQPTNKENETRKEGIAEKKTTKKLIFKHGVHDMMTNQISIPIIAHSNLPAERYTKERSERTKKKKEQTQQNQKSTMQILLCEIKY